MPGTHRTPPDAHDSHVFVAESAREPGVTLRISSDELGGRLAVVPAAALPALVAALASHLTVDARRALTRDLAAQDGDVVVDRADMEYLLPIKGGITVGAEAHPVADRLRASVEAARPTPTPEETHRG